MDTKATALRASKVVSLTFNAGIRNVQGVYELVDNVRDRNHLVLDWEGALFDAVRVK